MNETSFWQFEIYVYSMTYGMNDTSITIQSYVLYSKLDTIANFLPYITTLLKVIVRSITVWYS